MTAGPPGRPPDGTDPGELAVAPGALASPLPHRPPQAVGFLLSQLGFETARRFAILMAEVDLEPRHFALLRAITAYEGRSQNAIGTALRIPASSMVAVIDHLEGRGLVERRPHVSDRRSRTLHLTAAGGAALARATELAMGLEQTICAGLGTDEREDLLGMLGRVADNLGLTQGLHPGTAGHPPDHDHSPPGPPSSPAPDETRRP